MNILGLISQLIDIKTLRLFLPYDAKAIKSIPLSERRPNDELIWPGEKLGSYTIRSDYHFLMEKEQARYQ